MKVLLLLTSVIAVCNADSRDISEKLEKTRDPIEFVTNEDQEFVDGPSGITDGPQIMNIFTEDQQFRKTRKGQNKMELRGKKENKIIQKMSEDLKTIKHNMTQAYKKINMELESIKEHQGCPSGFFRLISSNQCFKIFTDAKRNWTSADAKCRAEGLMLAEPKDPISVRIYLMKKYSIAALTWVGAKGDGSYVRWIRGGDAIYSSSSLWYNSDPGRKVTTSYCLMILTTSYYTNKKYTVNPYYSNSCTYGYGYALCESVTSD